MAEGVGFEPTELSLSGFQDRRLKPLGHPSATEGQVVSGRWNLAIFGHPCKSLGRRGFGVELDRSVKSSESLGLAMIASAAESAGCGEASTTSATSPNQSLRRPK